MPSPGHRDASHTAPLPPAPKDPVLYVYAFVDATRLDDLSHLRDTDRPLSLHRVGAIGAVIRLVPAAEFCGIEGERNLANLDWIMPRICHHEAVAEGAMQCSPVFPTGFATLYASLDNLTGFMRRHEAAIAGFLRQVTGQQEWALKLAAELDDLETLEALAVELWPDWLGHSPGRRYLRLRQERSALLEVARERAAQSMPGIVDRLRPFTTAIHPLVRPVALQDADHQHVEEYALLVPVDQRAALHDRVNELAGERRRLHVALSGPWPPYSFRPSLDGEARGRPDERPTSDLQPTAPMDPDTNHDLRLRESVRRS